VSGAPNRLPKAVKGEITELAKAGTYTKTEFVNKAHELVIQNAVGNNRVSEDNKRH